MMASTQAAAQQCSDAEGGRKPRTVIIIQSRQLCAYSDNERSCNCDIGCVMGANTNLAPKTPGRALDFSLLGRPFTASSLP
jgi:hypothetical protein